MGALLIELQVDAAVHDALALQALLRRNEFDPGPRVALFAQLAARFRSAVPLPDDLADELTDEQYVRNVADVLFHVRPRAA